MLLSWAIEGVIPQSLSWFRTSVPKVLVEDHRRCVAGRIHACFRPLTVAGNRPALRARETYSTPVRWETWK